jgi:hypothetical protein
MQAETPKRSLAELDAVIEEIIERNPVAHADLIDLITTLLIEANHARPD